MNAERIPAEQIDMAHRMALYSDAFETELVATRAEEEALGAELDAYRTANPVPEYLETDDNHPTRESASIEVRDHELWTAWNGFKIWRTGVRAAADMRAAQARLDYAAGLDRTDEMAASNTRYLTQAQHLPKTTRPSPSTGVYNELAASYGPVVAAEAESEAYGLA